MALLEVKKLGISFGGLRAVDDLTMQVEEGALVGLIGPNGAGKTTVFNMLTGVYTPTGGKIELSGKSIIGMKPNEICEAGIARTFQNIRLFSKMSVLDNVKTALHNQVKYSLLESFLHLGSYHKKEEEMDAHALEILKVFDLDGQADYKACNLPYGKQRKLEIARALATNPKLLLLDEPAAGMNPNETKELMETIELVRNRFHVTILLIEHDMKLVAGICEYLYVLNFGTLLAAGEPSTVLKDPKVITAYLGDD
jgi:branched-chain amino acid transport system ATP-binding protein